MLPEISVAALKTEGWIMWLEWLIAELIYAVGIIAVAVMIAAVLRLI